MRKSLKKSFSELVNENKQELLMDKQALERIENKLDSKHVMKLAE
jgi:hypothetical protein